jgi:hypothetical protein
MKKLVFAALTASLLAGTANAATVLYRNDNNLGTDQMAAALSALGYTVTSTAGDLSGFTLTDFDIVVYATQNNSAPGSDLTALDSFIAGNGRVLFQTWTTGNPSLGADQTGNTNEAILTVGPLFSTGLTNPLTVINPGWGVYSIGLSATTGTVAGSFGNGDAGIIVGNGGRTIWNGFLTDTLSTSVLYQNQLAYLAGGTTAIPEAATWAMLIAGFGLTGAALRRRRVVAAAA